MKKVTAVCSFSIFCYTQVDVSDDFEFESSDPSERIDELESLLGVRFDELIPEPQVKAHESINDLTFDMWYDVSVD
ncbi:hypothetical protein G9H64_07425 [Aquirufa nivalisilvae]|jgi:hypothetical protein|uniref:Uncharacterized protein n=1 Tax=Aquirufa echingensis TaxID=3096516 RepID=A0ABW6D0G5_9BACT|nr:MULTISPECIES: hypothetical protein [Aquirufa]MBZ1326406.1 hypothetical protein [Aquirufa aurantiipilula]MCZ2480548.1 hypothetical protein [Aquirufa nivalisilvae]MCZ2482783.1 hypothetical protein [Aquirufa nivalisilvae]